MASSIMQDRMHRVSDSVGTMLDRLDKLVPEPKVPRSQPPMEQYLRDAYNAAQVDPEFAAKFQDSWRQYTMLAGGTK